jgi:hypothetical protein
MIRKNDAIRAAINLPPADQIVNEMLSESRVKEQETHLSTTERRWLIEKRKKEEARQEKAKKKEKAQRPNKVSYLIPLELRLRIKSIATENSVSESQVATFLLLESLRLQEIGKLSFSQYLYTSNSPRFDFQLVHPDDQERSRRVSKK